MFIHSFIGTSRLLRTMLTRGEADLARIREPEGRDKRGLGEVLEQG